MDSLERVSNAVRRHLKSHSSGFQTSSEHIRFLIQIFLASCLNAFSFLFERVWILFQAHLACRSNAFGFSFERIWLLIRTRWLLIQTSFVQHWNASIRQANTFGQNTLYLVSDRYNVQYMMFQHLPMLEHHIRYLKHHIHSSFSLIINTTFLHLNFSTISCNSLKFYSFNNVTTAHVQSNQGCVQIIKSSCTIVFR